MRLIYALIAVCFAFSAPVAQAARIKDVAEIYGKPSIALMGTGLVAGLNRTGDSTRNQATIQQIVNRLQGQGVTVNPADIMARNVASVIVTATMPADAKPGGAIDIEVASMGDARSLEGGVLLFTMLTAVDGQDYVLAKGPLVVGGYSADAAGNQVRKNHPTTARVPGGGAVVQVPANYYDLNRQNQVVWNLGQPDFTTANNMAMAINEYLAADYARALDSTSVIVQVPDAMQGNVIAFVSQLESLELTVDTPAKVVVNERTGTVVMGSDVKIAPVAVAHGGLSIEVQRTTNVSQPGALSGGQTVLVDNTRIQVEEEESRVSMVEGATIGDLVTALNSLGVSPRDLISILTAIRQAGAIHAAIETL
jgi:flagellar P-ring protein precursor FlgI